MALMTVQRTSSVSDCESASAPTSVSCVLNVEFH